MGSIEGGEAAERRFDGDGEFVGVDMGGSSVPSSGSGELAKERGMKLSGVLVLRLRARNRALGVCLGRATATARWRPVGRSVLHGKEMEAPAQGVEGGGSSGATRGRPAQAGGGLPAVPQRRRQRNRGAGRRKDKGDLFAISEILGTQL